MDTNSGVKGIAWDRSKGKWYVKVTRNYKQIALGRYKELEDAKAALAAYLANPDAPRVAKPTGRPKAATGVRRNKELRSRQHAVWRRMMKQHDGFAVWPHFDAFAVWCGEPKAWGVIPEDQLKPVGPDNFKWIDKPENQHDRNTPEGRRAYLTQHRKSRPELQRGYELKRQYGMSIEDYAKMLEVQKGVCAICKKPETHVKNGKLAMLAVDHCHSAGHVRGLLCVNCNLGIGYFKDDITALESAIAYLKKDTTT